MHVTGFHAPQTAEWQGSVYLSPDDDEAGVWTLRCYDISQDLVARDTLLWHAIAAEMPISPSVPIVTFLIDPDVTAMLHVYDDRGLDVIADQPAKLHSLYNKFPDWLLDYDRERMAAMF